MQEGKNYKDVFSPEDVKRCKITPLHIAVAENDLECCRNLLRKGAYPNGILKLTHRNKLAWEFNGALTPYDIAVANQNREIQKLLISYGGRGSTVEEQLVSVLELLTKVRTSRGSLSCKIIKKILKEMED